MPYSCQYAVDRGVNCKTWVREEVPYCERHRTDIEAIEAMWHEVTETVRKARRKLTEESS
jgi:hypothetical protein